MAYLLRPSLLSPLPHHLHLGSTTKNTKCSEETQISIPNRSACESYSFSHPLCGNVWAMLSCVCVCCVCVWCNVCVCARGEKEFMTWVQIKSMQHRSIATNLTFCLWVWSHCMHMCVIANKILWHEKLCTNLPVFCHLGLKITAVLP